MTTAIPSALSAAARKAADERLVFLEFAKHARLSIRLDSIESRQPPEPDILCHLDSGEGLAFELAEVCSAELARDLAE